MAQEVKKAWCWACHNRCRVLVKSENGRLIDIEEDRAYPMVDNIQPPTRACVKLRAAKEWMYHPDRMSFPLKRAGDRGSGKWQTITWEQALDEIAARLARIKERYGAEAVGLQNGTSRTMRHLVVRFFYLFGSPNVVGTATICSGPTVGSNTAMFGIPLRPRVSFIPQAGGVKTATRCILVAGQEASQSYWRVWKSMLDAKKQGAKIICIDPRRTESANLADLWLQVRPGTDTALLMSFLNVIIEEGLYDKEFVRDWCHGFDELRLRASEYPPEKVAGITWLPAEKIREAARIYATNKPALVMRGMGIEHLHDCSRALQALYALPAITGDIDVPGGHYLGKPPKAITEPELELWEMLPAEQKAKQLGWDRCKVLHAPLHDLETKELKRFYGRPLVMAGMVGDAHAPSLYRAILSGKPYPVKGMFTLAANPMLHQANTRMVYNAFKNLELLVVPDYWRTPTAELADYVLPITSWLERPALVTGYGTEDLIVGGEQALPSVVPGEYDRRTDYDVARGLAVRLGLKEYFPWPTLEEVYDYQLKPLGKSFQQFMDEGGFYSAPDEYRKYEKAGFATPTGKVELRSTLFEKLGYDPLPSFKESFENPVSNPGLAREYPLMLITGGRFQPLFHSEWRQVDSIRKRRPQPQVQIHPETARKLGIADGGWVWIESPRGRIRQKCQYFDGIDPRVVHCEHGWWFPELPGEEPWLHGVWESNVNVLTDDDPDHCDVLSGGWPLKTALCKVYPVKTF